MAEYHLTCQECNFETPEDKYYVDCPRCQGLLDVTLENKPSERVLDSNEPSIFKYQHLMPYSPQRELISKETFDDTPEFVDKRMSEELEIELIIKDETVLPTQTWKDREGFVTLHRLLKCNISDLMIFSSGNTGTSIARSATLFKGPRIHLVAPNESRTRIVEAMGKFIDDKYLKLHFFAGSNDECIVEAARIAKHNGYTIEGGFTNYARREGLKLFGLEHIFISPHQADWYVQPVAGGIGIYSFDKAFRDCGKETPRMLAVQAEICSPMVNAWKEGADCLEKRHIPDYVPSPFVRVLRTRNPGDAYRILNKIMKRCSGFFESVNDEEILEGLRTFYLSDYFKERYHSEGVLMGLEPATSLAGVIKAVRNGGISKGSKVLLNVSGAAKKGDVRLSWIKDLL